jgi:hypothetical protein
MAPRLTLFLVITTLAVAGVNLPQFDRTALAAGLDQKGRAEAKQATRLYKQGQYEEAAQIFARLSVDYPDMEIFERNLGACFYYLHRPEPALSNLRRYLGRKKNIAPDDKAVVDRWIDEMEKLSAQNAAASAPAVTPPAAPPATSPAPAGPPPPPAAAAPPVTSPAAPVPPPKTDEPAPAIATTAPIPPAVAPPPGEARQPAGLDLTSTTTPSDSTGAGTPFYKTWWFWTSAAVVVVGGAVTAIYFATRSHDPCDGANVACMGVK